MTTLAIFKLPHDYSEENSKQTSRNACKEVYFLQTQYNYILLLTEVGYMYTVSGHGYIALETSDRSYYKKQNLQRITMFLISYIYFQSKCC